MLLPCSKKGIHKSRGGDHSIMKERSNIPKVMFVGSGLSGFQTALKQLFMDKLLVIREYWSEEGKILAVEPHSGVELFVLAAVQRAKYPEAELSDECGIFFRREMSFLAEASGFVFVIDSREARAQASIAAFEKLKSDLRAVNRDIESIPVLLLKASEYTSPNERLYETTKSKQTDLQGPSLRKGFAWLLQELRAEKCL